MPVALVIAGITFFSCKDDKGYIKPDCTLPETVSFSNDIIPVFDKYCNTSGCHTGSNPSGHLSLDATVAYANLMKHGSGYIDTINPNYSLLYSQMISTSKPMPPYGNLDKCKTSLIFKWIQQKAKNN